MDNDVVLQWKTNALLLLTDFAFIIADILYLGYEWSIGKTITRVRHTYQRLFSDQASTALSNQCDLPDALNAIEVNLNKLQQSSACLHALRHALHRNLKCKLFLNQDDTNGVKTKHKISRFFSSFSTLFKQKRTAILHEISTEQNRLKCIDDQLYESQSLIECHLKYLQTIQHEITANAANASAQATHDVITNMMRESDMQLSILQQKQREIELSINEFDTTQLSSIAHVTGIIDAQTESRQLQEYVRDALHATLTNNRLPVPSVSLGVSHDINSYRYEPRVIDVDVDGDDQDADDDMKQMAMGEQTTPDGLMPKLDSILFVTQDTATFPCGLYVSHIDENPISAQNTHLTEYSIYQLSHDQQHKVFTKTNKWVIQYAGMCTHRNLSLPQTVTERIESMYDERIGSDDNLVVFKAGGYNEAKNKVMAYCSALVLPSTTARGYNWKLPSLPVRCYGNQMVFSGKHGLLSVGGNASNACHLLSFDEQAITTYAGQRGENFQESSRSQSPRNGHRPRSSFEAVERSNDVDWQWQSLSCMKSERAFSACLCFGDESKLAAIGGVSNGAALDTAEIFDWSTMQWSVCTARLNYARYESGCFYDARNTGHVVVGGGCGADKRTLNSCEYLDVHKQKWFLLPATNFNHYHYPVIWSQASGSDQHRLYMASLYANGVECIDLRANDKKWTVVFGGDDCTQTSPDSPTSSLHNLMRIDVAHKENYFYYSLNQHRIFV